MEEDLIGYINCLLTEYEKLQRVCDCAEKKAQLIKESLYEPDKVLIYVEALQQAIKEYKK